MVFTDATHRGRGSPPPRGNTPVKANLTHNPPNNHHNNPAVALGESRAGRAGPDDRMLWDAVHEKAPDGDLADGQQISVAGATLTVLHTPGHSPGGVCLVGDGLVFSGDTLFHGGPGATGRSFSDFPTILESIRIKLLSLPAETVVHTGHGADTTVGQEAESYDAWVLRGS